MPTVIYAVAVGDGPSAFLHYKTGSQIKSEPEVLIYLQGPEGKKEHKQSMRCILSSKSELFVSTINTSQVHVCNFFLYLYKG